MEQINRILQPQDRIFLNFSIVTFFITGIALIVGFHNNFLLLLFVVTFIDSIALYISRKCSSYLLDEYGISGRNVFRKIFISWEDIRMIDYQDPKLLGLSRRGYPKIILVSRAGKNINLMIEQYDRKDILSLIDDVVARGKNITLNEKLKVAMDYRILPNENIF